MAISKRLRFEILRRDNHACRYCGATAEDGPLTIDHVLAVALGGTDEASNLVTACKDCNAGKTSTTVDATFVEQVSEDSAKWDQAKAQVEEGRRAAAHRNEQELYEFRFEWEDYGSGAMDCDWKQSVTVWRGRGLSLEEIIDTIPKVMSRTNVSDSNRWRYFCGAMWNKVTELEEAVADEYRRLQAAEATSATQEVTRLIEGMFRNVEDEPDIVAAWERDREAIREDEMREEMRNRPDGNY